MRRKLGLVALVVAIFVIAAWRVFGQTPPEMRALINGSVSQGVGDTAYNAPNSVGGVMLCVTGAATATITSVAVHDATGDIRVEAFAVRLNPNTRGEIGLGGVRRTLSAFAADFHPAAVQEVSGVCPTDGQLEDTDIDSKLSELGIQVAFSSGAVAGGNSLDISYRINGTDRTTTIPFGIWLCAATCPDHLGA
jgi:hypothetical protein